MLINFHFLSPSALSGGGGVNVKYRPQKISMYDVCAWNCYFWGMALPMVNDCLLPAIMLLSKLAPRRLAPLIIIIINIYNNFYKIVWCKNNFLFSIHWMFWLNFVCQYILFLQFLYEGSYVKKIKKTVFFTTSMFVKSHTYAWNWKVKLNTYLW